MVSSCEREQHRTDMEQVTWLDNLHEFYTNVGDYSYKKKNILFLTMMLAKLSSLG